MTGALTPAQANEVRAIVAEMIGHALHGANDRIAAEISGSIVLLPIFHAQRDRSLPATSSSGKTDQISDVEASS